MKIYTILCLFALMLTACSQDKASTNKTPATDKTATQAPPPAPTFEPLPSLPQDMANRLVNECTSVDFIYYELPLSMNMEDASAVANVLSQISTTAAPAKPPCKSIARISYISKGERILEAELYYDGKQCNCFHFLENGKVKYGNFMTPQGVQFYQNAFAQAKQQFGN